MCANPVQAQFHLRRSVFESSPSPVQPCEEVGSYPVQAQFHPAKKWVRIQSKPSSTLRRSSCQASPSPVLPCEESPFRLFPRYSAPTRQPALITSPPPPSHRHRRLQFHTSATTKPPNILLQPHCPFPNPTMTTTDTPSPSCPPATAAPPPPPPPPPKKPSPAQAWSDHETSHLIAAYEEKWFSLGRGPLKAQQWDEVAASLASRCGYGSRTGTQCRHKMEKLRKRYRAERKSVGTSYWIHFAQIDRMERGPLPTSSRPSISGRVSGKGRVFDGDGDVGSEEEEEEEKDEEEAEEEEEDEGWEETSARGAGMRRSNGYHSLGFGEQGVDDKVGAVKRLAAVVRRFGEGFSRIEKRKMEMMRELERDWMEMEAKKKAMLMETERYLLDTITNAFHSEKKAKKPKKPAET